MKTTLEEVLDEASKSESHAFLISKEPPYAPISPDAARFIRSNLQRDYVPVPLDKDGEKINRSCLYYGADGRDWHILGFSRGRYNVIGQHEDKIQPLRAKWLSRNAPNPVLTIDDKEIEQGNCLYLIKSGNPVVVSKIHYDTRTVDVVMPPYYRFKQNVNARELISERDTLAKLRDEMRAINGPVGTITAGKWADRITAIMERGVL